MRRAKAGIDSGPVVTAKSVTAIARHGGRGSRYRIDSENAIAFVSGIVYLVGERDKNIALRIYCNILGGMEIFAHRSDYPCGPVYASNTAPPNLRDEKIALRIHRHAPRANQSGARRGSAVANLIAVASSSCHCGDDAGLRINAADSVASGVNDEKIAVYIYSHALRRTQSGIYGQASIISIASSRHGGDDAGLRVDAPHPSTHWVCDEEIALSIHGHGWSLDKCGIGCRSAITAKAFVSVTRYGGNDTARSVNAPDSRTLIFRYEDIAGSVSGDTSRTNHNRLGGGTIVAATPSSCDCCESAALFVDAQDTMVTRVCDEKISMTV